ncbi:MAG: PAS-domain containing protein [Rhizomicrobium sp.]
MHDIVSAIFSAFVQLTIWTSSLATGLGALGGHKPQQGELAMAAIVVASLLVCILGCFWALVERGRRAAGQHAMNQNLARAQSEIRFREAMISACPEAIVVMGADMPAPLSYRGGSALLQACLAGSDSTTLAARMKSLLEAGAPFVLTARTAIHQGVAVQGCVVGSRAAIFMRIEDETTGRARDFQTMLEAIPMPLWIRDRSFALTWANRAFLGTIGAITLDAARRSDQRLVRSERDLVGAVLEGNDVMGERRYAVVEGRRRALSVDMVRLPSAQVAGMALDVTETAQAEAQIRLDADANADLLDKVEVAVALFGSDRRLAFSNRKFSQMWGLPEAWLETHPAIEDIFDRLREVRRLPEQRDFQNWKKEHLKLFETDDGQLDEAWHVPGGVSVRVRAYPYLLGGVYYIFEDVSEALRLSTSLHMLTATQRATLDTIEDGMAVFGPDGRLKMHNAAFARLWHLDESDLQAEPHLTTLSALCLTRFGRDGIWSAVQSGVVSNEPARYGDWGRLARADGRILSLSLTRLPLGSTLVSFEDRTDLERFEAAIASDVAVA